MLVGNAAIHLWQVDLSEPYWDSRAAALSPTEVTLFAQAALSRANIWRRRARIALRQVLAAYARCDAGAVRILAGENGKPFVDGYDLHFNLSHANSLALIGVSQQPLGVDLEREDESLDVSLLLDWTCHAHELPEMALLAAEARRQAFYRLWVGKEAYCKATGVGLKTPMNRYRLCPGFENSACVVAAPEGENGYHVVTLPSESGWFAAVSTRHPASIRLRSFLQGEGQELARIGSLQ